MYVIDDVGGDINNANTMRQKAREVQSLLPLYKSVSLD